MSKDDNAVTEHEYDNTSTELQELTNQNTEVDTATTEAANEQAAEQQINNKVNRTRIGGTWIALILGILALVALLVFILQNPNEVELQIFAWTLNLPLGVGFLFAALFGALIMACVGAARMFQLRRQIKKRS
ncbi:MAG: lipopolysaccharide assembly protein LapA domain-containing protein [Corynebacterium sp.]|nr:lipopolysaccharide assembly protein LapA domain-containing protein [Corynebacterium sp.]